MKNKFLKIISFALAGLMCLCFAGCGESEDKPATSQTSAQIQTTQPTTQAIEKTEADIKALHTYDLENGDVFAGAWTITEGEGSKLTGFTFMFDGHGKATLVKDNMGYLGKYTLNADKSTFTTQLMFGLNGTYTYTFDGDDKVTLKNSDGGSNSVFERATNVDFIPAPEKDPKIDSKVVGAWQSDGGETYYFGSDGIMYQNQFGAMFTYANYTAESGKLTATYIMGEETVDEYEYSVEDDVLTLSGNEYKKISINDVE